MIRLENVTVRYGSKTALEMESLSLSEQGITCVIGQNGSGKSTLLRALAGIQPFQGTITLRNRDIREMKQEERARHIAYLPQVRPVPSIDVYTLISHGRFPHLSFSKTLREEDREAVEKAAFATRSNDLLARNVSELSGGERQRVYLAMLLAQDAEVVLLDEPATYLDIGHQLEVIEILRRMCHEGKRVIVAAHDLPQAFSFADEVLLLDRGKAEAFGTPEELCEQDSLRCIFGVTLRRSLSPDDVYSWRLAIG